MESSRPRRFSLPMITYQCSWPVWFGFTIFIPLPPKVTGTRIPPIIRISFTTSSIRFYNIQLISRSMPYLIYCPKSRPGPRSRLCNKTTFQVAWSLYPKSFTIHIYRCYQSVLPLVPFLFLAAIFK